jgi:hypothetical protein
MIMKEVQPFERITFSLTESWESDDYEMEDYQSGLDEEADKQGTGESEDGQGAAHGKVSVSIKDGVQGKLVLPLLWGLQVVASESYYLLRFLLPMMLKQPDFQSNGNKESER